MSAHRLCILHPADPRVDDGDVVTRRLATIVASRPHDFSLVWIGVDRRGDLALGRTAALDVAGRGFDFLPVAGSSGPGFGVGVLRRLSRIRAAARADHASIEVHDVDWAPIARLVLRPLVLVSHDDPHRRDGRRRTITDGLRERIALRLADRIVGLDADFVRRCRETGPDVAAKTEVMTLSGRCDGGRTPLGAGDEAPLARLWERHRRLYDVEPIRRGRHVAA